MEEIWKDIPNYEGLYQASNLGNIKSLICHNNAKYKIMKGRGNNYKTGKRVGLWKDGKPKDWLVARLVAITFLGKPKGNINTVNHINGDRMDNRIENLEWLTRGDNIRHAFNTGLMPTINVRLFNNEHSINFTSLRSASISLGRNAGYVSGEIKKGKTIVRSITGEQFNIEIIDTID